MEDIIKTSVGISFPKKCDIVVIEGDTDIGVVIETSDEDNPETMGDMKVTSIVTGRTFFESPFASETVYRKIDDAEIEIDRRSLIAKVKLPMVTVEIPLVPKYFGPNPPQGCMYGDFSHLDLDRITWAKKKGFELDSEVFEAIMINIQMATTPQHVKDAVKASLKNFA